MSETSIIYKMTILQMLKKSDFLLTNSQIADFFTDNQYTDYFTTQSCISDLVESSMISESHSHGTTRYQITGYGIDTLAMFADKVSEGINSDIVEYFKKNQMKMKKENSVSANYYPSSNSGFEVNCRINDGSKTIMDFTIHADTKEQAGIMCSNFKAKSDDVFMTCIDILTE